MKEVKGFQHRKTYLKRKIGTVVKVYSEDDEKKYYFYVCKKLAEKYPELVNEKETFDRISSKGRILTAHLNNNNNGTFDEVNNMVLINHFLDRMTTFLFHEIVHKIGFMASKGAELPKAMKEAGTEKVTAESMMSKYTKGYIFSNVWARFPNTISTYFLDYAMINQMNFLVGENAIEESVLKGNTSFIDKLKEKFGEQDANSLMENFKEMSYHFDYYSMFYKVLNKKEKANRESKIESAIAKIQEITLRSFDKAAEGVETKQQADDLLNTMLEYSNYRIRRRENDGFRDDEFEICFSNMKQKMQEKFKGKEFVQTFNPNSWNELEDFIEVEQIPKEEKIKIRELKKQTTMDYKTCMLLYALGIKKEKNEELEK